MNVSVTDRLKSKAEDILRDRKMLFRIAAIVLIAASALILRAHQASKADITIEDAGEIVQAEEIYVDIGGAVANPGVYKASPTTRLYEIIEMAGGLRSDADTDSVNQAAYVQDGEKIMIPVHREVTDTYQEDPMAEDSTHIENINGLININTASKAELMTLTGIGEVMADRIIEYRSRSLFKSAEDIKSVKGIGDATYEKIKDSITV